MIKRIFEYLTIPPYLRKDYDSTQVSDRRRRFWLFNFWVAIGGYTYYMLKDMARSEEEGEYSLLEFYGLPTPLLNYQRKLEAQINHDLNELLNTPLVEEDQSFYEQYGQETVDRYCNCETDNPAEQHQLGCHVWDLIREPSNS